MTTPRGISSDALSDALGITPKTFRDWVKQTGVKPIRRQGKWKYWDLEVLREVFKDLLANLEARKAEQGNTKAVDPDNGLTWNQSRMREQTIAQRLRNEEKAREMDASWCRTAVVAQAFSTAIQKVEQIPSKARSEAGLNETQAASIRRIVDACRAEIAEALKALQ